MNSASRLSNGRAGVGYYTEKAYFSAGYQRENGRFGIPFAGEFHAHGHEEEEDHHEEEELFVDVDTGRQSARFDAGLRNLDNRLFDAFRVVMNYIDYTHDEVETLAGVDTIATTFDNNVFVIRAEAEQRRTEELNGNSVWRRRFGTTTRSVRKPWLPRQLRVPSRHLPMKNCGCLVRPASSLAAAWNTTTTNPKSAES